MAKDLKYVGKPFPLKEASQKVTGQLLYNSDKKAYNLLHAKMLLSPIPHGIIKKINTAQAEKLPGVKGIFSYLNSPKTLYNSSVIEYDDDYSPKNELIFSKIVRHVGDRVAVVVAMDLETAQAAVDLIEVEYEELPVILDLEDALHNTNVQIQPPIPEYNYVIGNPASGFEDADYIFSHAFASPKGHHCTMETSCVIASCDSLGKVTIQTNTQNCWMVRYTVASALDIPLNDIRVIKVDGGGSFGLHLEATLEPLVAFLAKQTKGTVKLHLNRNETMLSTRCRTSVKTKIKTGVKKDGTITAMDIQVIADAGAYTSISAWMPKSIGNKVKRLYKIPNLSYKGNLVHTNTAVSGSFRGFGTAEIFAALDTHMGNLARELNLDQVEFRLKHVMNPYDNDPLTGHTFGNSGIKECLTEGAKAFGWDGKKNITSKNNSRYKYGIGVGCCAHTNGCFGYHQDFAAMTLRINEEGAALLNTGLHDLGGVGTKTMLAQIVSEVLDIEMSKVTPLECDTERSSYDVGTQATRTAYVGGNAAKAVSEKVMLMLLEEAAKMLSVPRTELIVEKGHIKAINNPEKAASYGEIVMYSLKNNKEIFAYDSYAAQANPTSYAVNFAEVRVDTKTGHVDVLKIVSAHDIGKAINPMLVEGQIQGGIAMGLGFALSEELEYTPEGKCKNPNFSNYFPFRASEMPEITKVLIEKGEVHGPWGAKGIAEITAGAVAPAIVNAVNNALNTNMTILPLNTERLLKEISTKVN
ncbi:MAG: hypothetical protein APF76_18060 [Desulfitibacter sp. BRH_c19]|nr:MAG: hypothetical protein APF76_18060 [Desulfitibacter sp. BRH_c19]